MSSKEVCSWLGRNEKLKVSYRFSICWMIWKLSRKGLKMENLHFDETREQDYSPATGLWMDQWDNDPTVWQKPMAETPYPWTLSQKYDQEYRQTEKITLVDVVMRSEERRVGRGSRD